jgi:hypothetical protein
MLQNDAIGSHDIGIAHLKDTFYGWWCRLRSEMDLDFASSPYDVDLRWPMLPWR